ncbi:MAG: 2-dehydro-3-deoxygalactonokinase, partial [Clostridia bacterium]|nr:2-dehydro-3-deoxygalactonokinase [Clostridia bacterium]
TADMMRGEETELMGIMSDDDGECAYILPGSHSKIIYTDSKGRIESFSTMLTGEMIASISQNTILKDAVDLSVSDMDEEYLMKGYTYCKNKGINEALFKTRVLKNLFGCNKEQTYSYFLGVILYNEIAQVIASGAGKIIIGGKSQIKSAMAYILKKVSDKKVICLDDEKVDMSTSLGMIKVYEY